MRVVIDWYIRNQDAITWFLIGWLAFAGLDALTEGRYFAAVFNGLLIWLNYTMSKVRL